KRILAKKNSPKAWANPIVRHPKTSGTSQFHRSMVTEPTTASAMRPKSKHLSPFINVRILIPPSSSRKLPTNRNESLSKVQHGVVLAREQRVDGETGLRGQLLEWTPFDLVC